MNDPAHVSIIVPVFNGGKNFARCLDALNALKPSPLEIIIVDDGSTDGSIRPSSVFCDATASPTSKVLRTDQPQSGPARARNLGAAHARGEILFFIDADVLVYPDAVQRIMRAFNDPTVSAIFGSYDDAPDDPSLISQYKNLLHHYVHQHSQVEATTFWAGCGAIRREVFQKLGGFSTVYARPSIEDIELGLRLAQSGGQIRLVKDLQVKHLKKWTLRSLLATDIRDRALPWAELIVRARQLPADLNLRPTHRLSALLCWLLVSAVITALFIPLLWIVVVLLIAALVALNFDLYRFFFSERGLWFTVRAIPLHWLYYLYSSAVIGWVLGRNIFKRTEDANSVRIGKSEVL